MLRPLVVKYIHVLYPGLATLVTLKYSEKQCELHTILGLKRLRMSTTNIVNIVNLNNVKDIKQWLQKDGNLYIGRPSEKVPEEYNFGWGNPYKLVDYYSRRKVIELYRQHVLSNRHLTENLTEIKGKVLGCWCSPRRCHAEVLHNLAGNHPVYQTYRNIDSIVMSSEGATKQLLVGNLGSNISEIHLRNFFDLDRNDQVKLNSSVELSTGPGGKNLALLHVPEEIFDEVLSKHNTELAGRVITVKDPLQEPIQKVAKEAHPKPTTALEAPIQGDGTSRTNYAKAATSIGFLSVVRDTDNFVMHDFIELDTTATNDPYHIPKTAEVNLAILKTFGEDADRYVFGAGRGRVGVYRIETPDIDQYRKVKELKVNEHDRPLALVTIKTERISIKTGGKLHRQEVRNPNDLLITLKDADKHILREIPNEDILRAIIALNVGDIKKSVQRQWDNKMERYTGNKYFVLQNVRPEDRSLISNHLKLQHPRIGQVQMWISHRYQIRRCWFCGDYHDAVCPIK